MYNESLPANSGSIYTLHGLNHLRAFAIASVFFYHYRMFAHPAWVDAIAGFGWTGVDLFFVLSGYLIASQLFNTMAKGKNISLIEFYVKRFFRIIPAYLFIVAIYFLIPASHEREALPPLWKYVSFTQNFNLDLRFQGTFSHAWSLCIEEQFYFLLPLVLITGLYLKLKNKLVYLLPILFITGFIVRHYSYVKMVAPLINDDGFYIAWYKFIYYPTYCRLDGLLIGITIAAIFRFKPNIKAAIVDYGNTILIFGITLLSLAYYVCGDQTSLVATVFGLPLVAVGYGVIVIAAIIPTSILFKYSSTITSNVATLSYSIYLSHKIIIHLVQQQAGKFNIDLNGNLMLLICIIASVLMALAMRQIIEIPFLKIRDYILAKRRNKFMLHTN